MTSTSVYRSHGCGYYFGPPHILETVKRYMYNKYRYVLILQTGFVFYGIHRKKLHTIKISNISKYNSSISHLLFSLFQKSIVARYFSSLKNLETHLSLYHSLGFPCNFYLFSHQVLCKNNCEHWSLLVPLESRKQ